MCTRAFMKFLAVVTIASVLMLIVNAMGSLWLTIIGDCMSNVGVAGDRIVAPISFAPGNGKNAASLALGGKLLGWVALTFACIFGASKAVDSMSS